MNWGETEVGGPGQMEREWKVPEKTRGGKGRTMREGQTKEKRRPIDVEKKNPGWGVADEFGPRMQKR